MLHIVSESALSSYGFAAAANEDNTAVLQTFNRKGCIPGGEAPTLNIHELGLLNELVNI